MKNTREALFVIVLGLAVIGLTVSKYTVAEEPSMPSGQYGVEVEFDISPDGGTYTCTAVVSDLMSGEVVAAPRVTARIGEEAVARSGMQVADRSYEVKLTFFADGTNATYVFEATYAGDVVAKQKSSVKL